MKVEVFQRVQEINPILFTLGNRKTKLFELWLFTSIPNILEKD